MITARADPHLVDQAVRPDLLSIYLRQSHGSPDYVRNPRCWAADLDLTCISPWNSRGGVTRAGTLITPRHVIFSAHYPLLPTDSIRFIGLRATIGHDHGVIITRNITHTLVNPTSDIGLARLDHEVPDTITPAALLPADYARYFAPATDKPMGHLLPVLVTDQLERIRYAELYALNMSFKTTATKAVISRPQYLALQGGATRWTTGDSGSPLFAVINNQPVLLTFARTSGSGPALCAYTRLLTQQINTWGDTHALPFVDLRPFSLC